MHEETSMTPKSVPQSFSSERALVLSTLEHDQLVKARKNPIPRRQLRGSQLAILWALRIYVFFMMIVVAYQFWIAAR
jgi:hypothetical protein